MKLFVQIPLIGLLLISFTACKKSGMDMLEDFEAAGLENPDKNVSFECPPGWEQRSIPGQTVEFVFGPPANGFAPNINVASEAYKGSLEAYAKLSIEQAPKMVTTFKNLKQETFKTKDGLEGIKLINEIQQAGSKIRSLCYIFDKGSKKYVITCSTLADGGQKLDSVFDASMKTFKFKK